MKIAIVGSRNLTVDLEKYLADFENIELIVSGGAKGIDTCAKNYAIAHNIPLKEFLPDYDKYGRRAPILRNVDIVDAADTVIAFWDGISRGTKFTIDEAKKKSKQTIVYKRQ